MRLQHLNSDESLKKVWIPISSLRSPTNAALKTKKRLFDNKFSV